MPIKTKDLGKYNRPAIFIEEINNSIVQLPVQNVLINVVPGFSKRGPVNKPIYVTSPTQFEQIFGSIDIGLERKSSYFHRTCLKMLESGPIWALNLLSTDDTRDTVSWKSISCASDKANTTTRTMPYSRLFNRQDFWERDSEAFLDYVNDPTIDTSRLFHITNLGEKTTTTFIYKSSISGFDVTAEDWYGGITKVPSYIHPKDWISDFMVSVLIIDGDWTDYNSLSVDSTWSTYFTSEGLDKTKIQSFVDEVNVTTVGFYDVSLIPYFKDLNNRNMYIKTVINNDTDKTGLFCAYNEDLLLDSDYPTGKIDIIGGNLVGEDTTSINFLSYQESIIESLSFDQTPLDSYGNVFGNYDIDMPFESSGFAGKDSRTGNKTNWYVDNATIGATGSTLLNVLGINQSSGKSYLYIDPTYSVVFTTAQTALVANDLVYFNTAVGGLSANTSYYVYDTDGTNAFSLTLTLGGSPITLTTGTYSNLYVQRGVIGISNLTGAFFNLGLTSYTFDTGVTSYVFEPLTFTSLSSIGYERYDTLYLTEGNNAVVNILKGEQKSVYGTAVPADFVTDYNDAIILGYVHLHLTSGVTGTPVTDKILNVDYTPITLNTSGYVPLTNITATGYTIGTSNYVKLTFGNTSGLTDYNDYTKIRYRAAYNEMELYLDDSKGVIINQSTGYKYPIENATFTDYSTQSDANIIIPVGSQIPTQFYDNTNTYKWLVYYLDNEFYIKGNTSNRLLTTLAPVDDLTASGQTAAAAAGVIGKYSTIYLDYYNGIINNGDYGYTNNDVTGGTQIYLKMWIENEDEVYVDFMDEDKISPKTIDFWTSLKEFVVWSNISNYKQSVEIESFDTTKLPNLVYEIKVDKVRYSEIIKGDFLESYYNEADYQSGGIYYGYAPKKLCRVISTTIDTTNTNWKVLRTDLPIKITAVETTYQTTVYPQIDEYVDTYKGVALVPFRIHADSLPNGTESRQTTILNVIEKTTNLAKGLVNKNKISWRYLVDSFGLGLTDKSKQQLVDICGMKLNCLGFISAPSVKTLKKSTNPYFINDDMTLNTTYLKEGGDETRNPSFLYSFGNGAGASCVSYFFPFVTVDDNGTPKSVPPASHACTTYMQKFITNQSSVEPWTICAGISNGRVTNIAGVEMDFSDDDLANLYAMNLNPIVKMRNAGYCINSESTAQVFPYSSLSITHTREVLIELENALYDMLLRYQWKFNTPEIRAEIKFRADSICKNFQNRNALYNFKNIMDETNNTNYIIDLQMGVLDTYVEVIKGMGIIVNNITILKKGDIESGGFQ
jgi:hypothetical protein